MSLFIETLCIYELMALYKCSYLLAKVLWIMSKTKLTDSRQYL